MKSLSSAVLVVFLLLVSFCRAQVVELTDATFEHQTQVSTVLPRSRRRLHVV